MTSTDAAARAAFGVSSRTIADRIGRVFAAATPADIESGARWYDAAGELASELGASSGHGRERAAAVIAHLSPRTSWTRNIAGAVAMLSGELSPVGQIGANVARARGALESSDPLATLRGPKTSRFARNILGDREAVTVDVWACRVAGVDETKLSRKGAYDAVESAYRLAARRAGVDPATMQAVTWVVARGGRAS